MRMILSKHYIFITNPVRSHHGQVKDNISVDKSYQESSSSIPRTIPSVSYGEEVKAGAGHH